MIQKSIVDRSPYSLESSTGRAYPVENEWKVLRRFQPGNCSILRELSKITPRMTFHSENVLWKVCLEKCNPTPAGSGMAALSFDRRQGCHAFSHSRTISKTAKMTPTLLSTTDRFARQDFP
jgi:hypothetical protein